MSGRFNGATGGETVSGYFMQPQRRSYSKSFKAQVIQECAQPGASIVSIALSHSLSANLVHKWIRMHTQKNTALQPAFIPLPVQMLHHNPTHAPRPPLFEAAIGGYLALDWNRGWGRALFAINPAGQAALHVRSEPPREPNS